MRINHVFRDRNYEGFSSTFSLNLIKRNAGYSCRFWSVEIALELSVLFSPLLSIHKALQHEKGAQISTGQTQEQLLRKTGNATNAMIMEAFVQPYYIIQSEAE